MRWWLVLAIILIGLGGGGLSALRHNFFEQVTLDRTIPVPTTDVPVYRLISARDLTMASFLQSELPPQVITSTVGLSRTIALAPLKASQPITLEQIVLLPDSFPITDTVIVAIQGESDLVFGGQLESGRLVAAWVDNRQLPDRLFVVDVQPSNERSVEESQKYTIVLALPSQQVEVVVNAARQKILSLSLGF
jgi:hypothetical protein